MLHRCAKRYGYTCGLDAAVDVVGGKWKPLILWEPGERPHRFGELRRAVGGITEKVLIGQLRQLERDGVVERRAFPEIPPRVEYRLTPDGEALNAALDPLGEWGERHVEQIAAARRRATAV